MSRRAYISDPSYSPGLKFSLRTILIVFVVAAPILWLIAAARNHSIKHEAEIAARTKSIWATLNEAAQVSEQIRTCQGRAPIDRAEIEAILDHSMSVDVGLKEPCDIYYERPSPGNYRLIFPVEWLEGFSVDYLMFDSTTPQSGWVSFCN